MKEKQRKEGENRVAMGEVAKTKETGREDISEQNTKSKDQSKAVPC